MMDNKELNTNEVEKKIKQKIQQSQEVTKALKKMLVKLDETNKKKKSE